MRLKYIQVLTLCLLFFTSPHFLLADEEKEIRIGVITDLTGLAAYWGKQTAVGVELLQDEFSAADMPVKIIVENHNLDPKLAVTAAQKLLFVDKVDAVYSEFTMTAIAASAIVKNAKKLFMGDCAANSFLERNPYSFKTYIDYTAGCQAVATRWKKKGIKRIGVLKAETEYGELCADGVRKVFPESFIVDYKYGEAVRTQALLLKKHKVQAVLNASFEGDVLNMLEAFRAIDYMPLLASNFDAYTDNVRKKYSTVIDEFTTFGFKKVSDEFIKKVKTKDPENSLVSIEGAALAYIHIKQFVDALRTCKKDDIECQLRKMQVAPHQNGTILGFQGFKDRTAIFPPDLVVYRGTE